MRAISRTGYRTPANLGVTGCRLGAPDRRPLRQGRAAQRARDRERAGAAYVVPEPAAAAVDEALSAASAPCPHHAAGGGLELDHLAVEPDPLVGGATGAIRYRS